METRVLNGDVLHVRSATATDQDGIIALIKRVLPEFDLAYEADGADRDVEDIQRHYLSAGGSFEVVVDGTGQVVGTAGLLKIDAHTGRLRKMYLDPRYRGHGVGALLLRRAIAFAEHAGLERIELDTVHTMHAAQRLYEQHGFTRVAGEVTSPRCDVFMERILTPTP
jgi:putative acetyltransferase